MHERMKILYDNGVITGDSYQGILSVINTLNDEWKLNNDDEQYQMAMTHLVRAIDRVRREEPVTEGLDVDIESELMASEYYFTILEMNERVCSMMGVKCEDIPKEEKGFLICNLLSIYLKSN
ncbi:hypothetical protein [Vibrio sp.]|uniref:hypothetical protein n=1 Tax=Vibrio sp. TaxID=678 RepID=UPI003AA93A03